LDGSAFAEKYTAEYRSEYRPEAANGVRVRAGRKKGGGEFLLITDERIPTLNIYATPAAGDGGFSLVSLSFLASSVSGWNEFSRELAGSGTFLAGGDRAALKLDESFEVLDISEGKIRRKDARLRGTEALSALRNRQERIDAITGWMRGQDPGREFSSQREFEAHWKPILFPELTPAKKRPPGWSAAMTGTAAEEEEAWISGEHVKWNTRYTEALLPEELRPVRNSGALLRDWEEAAAWIYFQFEWERIMRSFTNEIQLVRIK
jgi:hypothetical protein